jgi:hypothetical protein
MVSRKAIELDTIVSTALIIINDFGKGSDLLLAIITTVPKKNGRKYRG